MPNLISSIALMLCFVFGYWIFSVILSKKYNKKVVNEHRKRSTNQSQSYDQPKNSKPLQWFEILGVSEFSSNEVIQTAYRAKIRAYHPDRVADLGAEFNEIADRKSKEINKAYNEAKKLRRIR